MVIVDDVCTTGASTIAAIEAAQEAGMKVAAVVCIVEREEANGRPAVEAAAKGAPFLRLFTANDVRAEHVKQLAACKILVGISAKPQRADPCLGPALRALHNPLHVSELWSFALFLNGRCPGVDSAWPVGCHGRRWLALPFAFRRSCSTATAPARAGSPCARPLCLFDATY